MKYCAECQMAMPSNVVMECPDKCGESVCAACHQEILDSTVARKAELIVEGM